MLRIGLLLAAIVIGPAVGRGQRPNILWLSCEDISPHLGCYGDPHAITPNLDALAAQGTRFSHAFTAAGVCAPCRSTIITGMYQNSIGTHHMRCNARLPAWLKPFPILLREAGYYCTNNSKTDYQFQHPSASDIWDESSSRAHWKNRPDGVPFFAVFNFTGCHESGIASEAKYRAVTAGLTPDQRQDPARLTTLPPYYPDTPIVREDWKRNYELITAMDAWVGQHLQALEEAGLADDTIVFFWSDHGVGLPRAKRWLYDSGTRIPLIVRIPQQFRVAGQGQPGSVESRLVSSVDFGPTVLRLCGVDVPAWMQGQPFLGGDLPAERSAVFGARDRMDERYDVIRSMRDHRFRYIRNFEPLKPYYQYMNTPEKGATMKEIRRAEREGTLPPAARQYALGYKPAEELYDLQTDPHEIHNLAEDPRYQQRLQRMREALLEWQMEVRDIGLIPEAEIVLREAEAGSRYDILRQEGGREMVAVLVEIADAASQGLPAKDRLLAALHNPDASIRYWAATGLGNMGRAAGADALQALQRRLDDGSPSVRIAAARGVCRLGDVPRGLPVLVEELRSPHEWGRLAAAIVLDEMEEQARPALSALQQALHDQPNKYIVRVANKAVNDLLGTEHQVP
ncbi:MAG: DUF229 domain-containing protein [Planctomycetota bacterium]|nr:MAG: DUF229 domain-containing protein [Planctomycetota bacterium]